MSDKENNQTSPAYEKNPSEEKSETKKKKLKRKRSEENFLMDSPIKKLHKDNQNKSSNERDSSSNNEEEDNSKSGDDDDNNQNEEEINDILNDNEEKNEDNQENGHEKNQEEDEENKEDFDDGEINNDANDINLEDEGSEKPSEDDEGGENQNNAFEEEFMKKMKKPSGRKNKDIDDEVVDREVNYIIDELKKAYDEDVRNLQQKKPALKKMAVFKKIEKSLKNFKIQQEFITKDGLDIFEKWLKPQPDGTKPSLFLKKAILENLKSFSLDRDQCSKNDIGKIINRISLSTDEPNDLRKLAKTLIDKWTRLLTNNHINYRSGSYRSEIEEMLEKPSKKNSSLEKKKTNEVDILNTQNQEVKYVVLPKKNNIEFFKNAKSNVLERKAKKEVSEGTVIEFIYSLSLLFENRKKYTKFCKIFEETKIIFKVGIVRNENKK